VCPPPIALPFRIEADTWSNGGAQLAESDLAFQAKTGQALGLTEQELDLFAPLTTPERIQDLISAIPCNFETDGDTCRSVRTALKRNEAHCIEGAFIGACALLLHGRPALLMDFQAEGDDDHVVALFRHGRCWGAISKSNKIWLRWRDPIYKSLRELAMSYFHEYVIGDRKTLRTYSPPFDIGQYDPKCWVTASEDCWDMAEEIDQSRHYPLLSRAQAKRLRRREKFECSIDEIWQYDNRLNPDKLAPGKIAHQIGNAKLPRRAVCR
jgi:hypothetical protein